MEISNIVSLLIGLKERRLYGVFTFSAFVHLKNRWDLTSFVNIWAHIATVPSCSSGTLTNVLRHRNAVPQTQNITPHLVTVYRHGADLCYPLMWNATLEHTTSHFNVLGQTSSTQTSERLTLSCCTYGGRPSEAR